MTRYFADGANMSRAALRQRCADARAIGPGRLEGYQFFVGRAGWGSIAPQRGARVHGVLWRLTPRCLAALHAFEWLHKGLYDMRRLPVRVGSQHVPAMVYLLRSRQRGQPKPGYVQAIAAAARGWRLPEPYIRSLERRAASRFSA